MFVVATSSVSSRYSALLAALSLRMFVNSVLFKRMMFLHLNIDVNAEALVGETVEAAGRVTADATPGTGGMVFGRASVIRLSTIGGSFQNLPTDEEVLEKWLEDQKARGADSSELAERETELKKILIARKSTMSGTALIAKTDEQSAKPMGLLRTLTSNFLGARNIKGPRRQNTVAGVFHVRPVVPSGDPIGRGSIVQKLNPSFGFGRSTTIRPATSKNKSLKVPGTFDVPSWNPGLESVVPQNKLIVPSARSPREQNQFLFVRPRA